MLRFDLRQGNVAGVAVLFEIVVKLSGGWGCWVRLPGPPWCCGLRQSASVHRGEQEHRSTCWLKAAWRVRLEWYIRQHRRWWLQWQRRE